jgi:alginate O-acetyltransferase complex protein AlgI
VKGSWLSRRGPKLFFNSLAFIFLFLPVVMAGYYLLGGGGRGRMVLAPASLLFYFLLIPDYLPLLLVSIAFNFTIGSLLIRVRRQPGRASLAPYVLWLGILGDLGLLGYYKYFNFAVVNLDQLLGLSIPAREIILPLGISFFTFTQIAFIVDTYRGDVEGIRPLAYLQFVTFFPHLIAGPIYHHADMIPQLEDETKTRVNWTNIDLGVFFFFFGLAKKVIIADTLATVATPIFAAVADGGTPMFVESWLGALAYTLQIYFDFSGYCDMAIGIALLFNIRFPLNFFSPYRVTSVIDFWRSWNITLSDFLRDYLYIPLGGNRYGVPDQMRNLLVTMLLGGLWHGAKWTFVVWGGLHGAFLVANHLWRRTGVALHGSVAWLVTFLAVIVAWVFFRADSVTSAVKIVEGMAGWNGIGLSPWFPGAGLFTSSEFTPLSHVSMVLALGIILGALGIALLLPNLIDMTQEYQTALSSERQGRVRRIDPLGLRISYRRSVRWSVIVGIVAAIAILSLQATSEFLYYQF